MLSIENDFYPQFVQEHTTVTVSSSLRRGDTVATLDAADPDLTTTCHGQECPCAQQAFAIESGNTEGLFAIDGYTGLVSAASDLDKHDGEVFKLFVSVVNRGLDLRTTSDVRGPKNYGTLTIVIGPSEQQSDSSDNSADERIHIRHKRASFGVLFTIYSSFVLFLFLIASVGVASILISI